ncbi:MAG: hypothetical protein ACM3KF_00920 [Acidobacteriota bacterium]
MSKVTLSQTKSGNYDVKATCPDGHVGYKKRGDTSNTYKCWDIECGLTVP